MFYSFHISKDLLVWWHDETDLGHETYNPFKEKELHVYELPNSFQVTYIIIQRRKYLSALYLWRTTIISQLTQCTDVIFSFMVCPLKKIGLIFTVFLFLNIYPFIIKYYKIQCLTDSSFQDLITCLYSDSKMSLD